MIYYGIMIKVELVFGVINITYEDGSVGTCLRDMDNCVSDNTKELARFIINACNIVEGKNI